MAIDETAELKAGDHTVAVGPRHAGITGQVENCQTVVGGFPTLRSAASGPVEVAPTYHESTLN
jgi:hypothetical protein